MEDKLLLTKTEKREYDHVCQELGAIKYQKHLLERTKDIVDYDLKCKVRDFLYAGYDSFFDSKT